MEHFPAFQADALDSFSLINAWWLANLSLLAYHPSNQIERLLNQAGFTLIDSVLVKNTFCFLAKSDQCFVLLFRGTQFGNKHDAKTDLNFPLIEYELNSKVHRGFLNAFEMVWDSIQNCISACTDHMPFYISGHSLGAALAVLAHTRLKKLISNPIQTYTFGSPRIGDQFFKQSCEQLNINRVTLCCDLVAHLPPRALGFQGVGKDCFIDDKYALLFDADPKTKAAIEWKAALKYALGFPLFRKRQVSFRALTDHSINNYVIALWNAYSLSTN